MGKEKVSEEFKIVSTTYKSINNDISKFRLENPDYEIFTISAGGIIGGKQRYSVIWRMK
ncbi:MAG: hypothetical protein ACTSP9_05080 [Promethearchaeota archaeon]